MSWQHDQKCSIWECHIPEYWNNMMNPISLYLQKNHRIKSYQMAWEVFVISIAKQLRKKKKRRHSSSLFNYSIEFLIHSSNGRNNAMGHRMKNGKKSQGPKVTLSLFILHQRSMNRLFMVWELNREMNRGSS